MRRRAGLVSKGLALPFFSPRNTTRVPTRFYAPHTHLRSIVIVLAPAHEERRHPRARRVAALHCCQRRQRPPPPRRRPLLWSWCGESLVRFDRPWMLEVWTETRETYVLLPAQAPAEPAAAQWVPGGWGRRCCRTHPPPRCYPARRCPHACCCEGCCCPHPAWL